MDSDDHFANTRWWVRSVGDNHATASDPDQGFHVSKCYDSATATSGRA
jgi:hypothetical protein